MVLKVVFTEELEKVVELLQPVPYRNMPLRVTTLKPTLILESVVVFTLKATPNTLGVKLCVIH